MEERKNDRIDGGTMPGISPMVWSCCAQWSSGHSPLWCPEGFPHRCQFCTLLTVLTVPWAYTRLFLCFQWQTFSRPLRARAHARRICPDQQFLFSETPEESDGSIFLLGFLTGFLTSWDPLFLLFSQFSAPTNGEFLLSSAQSCENRRPCAHGVIHQW